MRYIIPALITVTVGLTIFFSLLFDNDVLRLARQVFTDWVVILAGLALLLGVLHLMTVHLNKLKTRTRGWPYSFLVILSAIGVLVVGLLEGQAGQETLFEPTSLTQIIFEGVLVATQASLAGLIVFFLIYAATRMLLNVRVEASSLLFLLALLVVLLGWIPIASIQSSLLPGLRNWLLQVPITAGARGILLGVALGTVMVGLRVLTGTERPYKD